MPRLPTLTAVLLIAALPATGQDESHVQAVTGSEDRSETRLGETAYASQFEGLWAVDGQCGEHDLTWAFAPNSIDMGRTSCIGLGKMTWEEDGLVIPLSSCTRMGEDVEPERLVLHDPDGPEITVVYGGEAATLLPCTEPIEN